LKTTVNNNNSRSGIALVLVMLTIIVLSAIVGALAISMNTEVRLARNTTYNDQLEWMGRSGMEVARYALANKCPDQTQIDALNQCWAGGTSPCSNSDFECLIHKTIPLGAGTIYVDIKDMERKWDINVVAMPRNPQKEILQKALAEIGVTDAEQSSTIIDSILDWMNASESSGFSGAKSDYYLHLNPPYYCKNGQIDDITELLLVKGVTPEIFWGSNSTNHPVSAYEQHGGGAFSQPTGTQKGIGFHSSDLPQYPCGLYDLFGCMGGPLNVNTAGIRTMQLIPGIDENVAARIIEQRAGPDGVDGTDDDVPFNNPGEITSGISGSSGISGAPQSGVPTQALASYVGVRSYVFDVTVDAQINGYTNRFHGILSRGGGNGQSFNMVKFYWDNKE
jgi:general secretion pathway protein K